MNTESVKAGPDNAASGSTFLPEDVSILLKDITGTIEPLPTPVREKLIQSGVHYSEMLPLESLPSPRYLGQYYKALDSFSRETARAVAAVSEKICGKKGRGVVLVSLARAGTPAGVLIKRYLRRAYGIDPPHYTISIVRGRGIDGAAMEIILGKHRPEDIQFIDGWTGKGAILGELEAAVKGLMGTVGTRTLLAVLADPANVTDMCGTREDIPIASSFLNSTVCGLMSRTVMPKDLRKGELHGVAYFSELRGEDRTYEFIDRIESFFSDTFVTGTDEVREIAAHFGISDINFVKPGIGEATRVLLRRVPDMILVAPDAPPQYVAHIIELAGEKNVPVVEYPLRRYRSCGIIKNLSSDA